MALLLFAEEAEALLFILLPLARAGLGDRAHSGGQGVRAARGGGTMAAELGGRGTGDRLNP